MIFKYQVLTTMLFAMIFFLQIGLVKKFLCMLNRQTFKIFNLSFVDISRRIGFTASVSNSSASWNNGTLVFPEVITNVGNGYNETDGVFTAPLQGEYVFFVNVQSNGNQHIYVHIMLNGIDQVTAIAFGNNYNYYEAGGNLAVLTLQKEDRVWIEHYEGQGFHYDGHLTTFSGFLL